MSSGYLILSGLAVLLFCAVGMASYRGYGLTSDSQALAQARARTGGSVRGGSLHRRNYYGGGPGFGK
jgi:hypothetical protein